PNCVRDTTIQLNSSNAPTLTLSNSVNPGCGANNGSITAALAGGTPPYTVTVDAGGQQQTINIPVPISQAIPNLPAGTVTITVVDAAGCQTIQTASLTNPTAPTISVSATPETCAGDNDGTVTIQISGGTAPYTTVWSVPGSGNTLTGLAPGTYSVTVTDANNCEAIDSATVNAGPPCCDLEFTYTTVN